MLYTFVDFVLGVFTIFFISGLVSKSNIVEDTINTTDWITIFVVNKLTINANNAPIENQNTKNPNVNDSIIKHIPEIINQNCHISIPPLKNSIFATSLL